MSHRLTLILGGARSGKSDFALRLAKGSGRRVLFVATAAGDDCEMRERIARHRQARPAEWRTIEAPVDVAQALAGQTRQADLVVMDCLTLLASNILMEMSNEGQDERPEVLDNARQRLQAELESVVERCRTDGLDLVIVSNEVGLGIVPVYPLGRAYRDLLGWGNAYLAARADAVYFMVAGLPLDLKALERQLGRE